MGTAGRFVARGSGALGEQVADFLEQHFLTGRRGRGGRCLGRMRLFQSVDELDGEEKHERDDQKIDDALDECAVLDQDVLTGGIFPQPEGQIREVEAADDLAQHRHENVADQGRHDLSEGSADDHADGEVDHVALHRKLFEFRRYTHGCLPWTCGRESLAPFARLQGDVTGGLRGGQAMRITARRMILSTARSLRGGESERKPQRAAIVLSNCHDRCGRLARMSVLTINAGSSSIRFAFYGSGSDPAKLEYGKIERIGESGAAFEVSAGRGKTPSRVAVEAGSFRAAVDSLVEWLESQPRFAEVTAVGH